MMHKFYLNSEKEAFKGLKRGSNFIISLPVYLNEREIVYLYLRQSTPNSVFPLIYECEVLNRGEGIVHLGCLELIDYSVKVLSIM